MAECLNELMPILMAMRGTFFLKVEGERSTKLMGRV